MDLKNGIFHGKPVYILAIFLLIAALILKYIPLAPVPLWLGTIARCGGLYLLLEKQFAIKQA